MPPGRSAHELNRDYVDLLAKCRPGKLPPELDDELRAFHRFVQRQTHHLARWPGLLFPLAIAQPEDSPVRAAAQSREEQALYPDGFWLRRLNPPPTDPNPALLRVLEGHTDGVSSVALSADGRHAVSGSSDRTLRYWDLQTGGCVALFPCDCLITCVALTLKPPWTVWAGDKRGNVYFFRIEEPVRRRGSRS
ncbi:MAG: hypothetical protein ABIP48_18520 [Planctomycetota bacterium]